MADARVYWVAISKNGQFPVTPHTYKWLEKNTGVESGYCSLAEMKPAEWRIEGGMRLWKAEGWLAIENHAEAAGFILQDFLKKLPNDRDLILIFTLYESFLSDPIAYPFIVCSLFARMDMDGSKAIFESLQPTEITGGERGFLRKEWNLTGRGGLTNDKLRAAMIAKVLACGSIIAYVRRATRSPQAYRYGISTNT